MQPLCAVSRASTKVTISQNQTVEVIVDNELWYSQFQYGAILPTSFRPESPIFVFAATL